MNAITFLLTWPLYWIAFSILWISAAVPMLVDVHTDRRILAQVSGYLLAFHVVATAVVATVLTVFA